MHLKENIRRVKKAQIIPWLEIEQRYAANRRGIYGYRTNRFMTWPYTSQWLCLKNEGALSPSPAIFVNRP